MKTSKKALIKRVKTDIPDISGYDIGLIEKAYDFGMHAHKGQFRANGDQYFEGHCVPVAHHILDLGLDTPLICAALLHDTIEDTDVTANELEEFFGKEISYLVEGVSKLGKLKYRGNERHVESLRKFFVSIAEDVRVVILKLADRWHNLETLEYLPENKRQRIALESIMIHGQLASRLGMGKLVVTLNDLAFPYAYPAEYEKTRKLMDFRLKKASGAIKKMHRGLLRLMSDTLDDSPHIDKRVKSTYSLYKKLERRDYNVDKIYDLIALRVIVKDISECYKALGAIHSHWRPVPSRVKDFIAVPKLNGYQSLHTSLFTGDGFIVEVQIRTEDMHEFNEFGIASHHAYKNTNIQKGVNKETFAWIEQLRKFQTDDVSPNEYLKRLKTDFFNDRIFVCTPAGDIIDLPVGATVLDFAYAVHSKIGDHASGGKVNGKYMALKTELRNEDIVEIETNKSSRPSNKWLNISITSSAQSKIRRYIKKHIRRQ